MSNWHRALIFIEGPQEEIEKVRLTAKAINSEFAQDQSSTLITVSNRICAGAPPPTFLELNIAYTPPHLFDSVINTLLESSDRCLFTIKSADQFNDSMGLYVRYGDAILTDISYRGVCHELHSAIIEGRVTRQMLPDNPWDVYDEANCNPSPEPVDESEPQNQDRKKSDEPGCKGDR